MFTADENGIVHKIEVNKCEIEKEFTGINVDNIYQLVAKNGIVITAGHESVVTKMAFSMTILLYLQEMISI